MATQPWKATKGPQIKPVTTTFLSSNSHSGVATTML
jgi:hypothetical protein